MTEGEERVIHCRISQLDVGIDQCPCLGQIVVVLFVDTVMSYPFLSNYQVFLSDSVQGRFPLRLKVPKRDNDWRGRGVPFRTLDLPCVSVAVLNPGLDHFEVLVQELGGDGVDACHVDGG